AEIGLRNQQGKHQAQKDHGEEIAGNVRLLPVFGEQPRTDDHEGGLEKLGRLDGHSHQRKPSARALDLDTDIEDDDHQDQHHGHDDERQPPDLPRIEKGHGQHRAGPQQGKDDLAGGKVERIETNPLGHGGACRKGQDNTEPHEREERSQKPAIHGPPPHGDRASVKTAYLGHQRVPPTGWTPFMDCTACLKASPRISKFLNWSKLAQAGESSTTASLPSSAAASAAACSTAASSVPAIS